MIRRHLPHWYRRLRWNSSACSISRASRTCPMFFRCVLGGSWIVISGVISPLICIVTLLITHLQLPMNLQVGTVKRQLAPKVAGLLHGQKLHDLHDRELRGEHVMESSCCMSFPKGCRGLEWPLPKGMPQLRNFSTS